MRHGMSCYCVHTMVHFLYCRFAVQFTEVFIFLWIIQNVKSYVFISIVGVLHKMMLLIMNKNDVLIYPELFFNQLIGWSNISPSIVNQSLNSLYQLFNKLAVNQFSINQSSINELVIQLSRNQSMSHQSINLSIQHSY